MYVHRITPKICWTKDRLNHSPRIIDNDRTEYVTVKLQEIQNISNSTLIQVRSAGLGECLKTSPSREKEVDDCRINLLIAVRPSTARPIGLVLHGHNPTQLWFSRRVTDSKVCWTRESPSSRIRKWGWHAKSARWSVRITDGNFYTWRVTAFLHFTLNQCWCNCAYNWTLHTGTAMNQDQIHLSSPNLASLSRNHPSRGQGSGGNAFHTPAAAMTRSLREERCEAIVKNANGFPYSR